ncbi:RNA polymerase sporulation-specific sigma factor [Caloramator quimbayensis]|uniref:RNA polymerase sigma factor n=1 Tax=Caloramator quimbayensis TaxID=1147123 RepID=A0A1T4WQJ2_9CLOT|nr:RNA polymerase sporulation sigma factor SigF [Caloramator quimbayensis]SKA79642.1 RNA polymerase sporulation-specific sigma factor [Caloramator quimbayensis]
MKKAEPDYNRIPNQDEVIELVKKSQQGDREAQDRLVRANVGLVSVIVKKFLNRGYEYEDLFQIGCIGLVKAIRNFNSDFNVKFSTYAVPMIMGEIKRFIRDDGIIKVSRNMKETAKKVKIAKEKLVKEYGREVTIEEISKELSITSEDIVLSLESLNAPEYLYDTIHQDDGSPVLLIDKISEEKDYGSDVTDKVALKEIINSLEPKARQVIILRYFKDMTQSEIAQILGISQVQVSRIEKKVLDYMRKTMT